MALLYEISNDERGVRVDLSCRSDGMFKCRVSQWRRIGMKTDH